MFSFQILFRGACSFVGREMRRCIGWRRGDGGEGAKCTLITVNNTPSGRIFSTWGYSRRNAMRFHWGLDENFTGVYWGEDELIP